jgi:hypothetical protein
MTVMTTSDTIGFERSPDLSSRYHLGVTMTRRQTTSPSSPPLPAPGLSLPTCRRRDAVRKAADRKERERSGSGGRPGLKSQRSPR